MLPLLPDVTPQWYSRNMYEVELKAHVAERNSVIANLNSFASFCGTIQKDDVYWEQNKKHRFSFGRKGQPVKVRIRRETITDAASGKQVSDIESGMSQSKCAVSREDILFTYKQKEIRTGADGTAIEVNNEKECSLSSAEPVESFLADAGFSPALRKHKTVLDWKYDGALFELCTVPPLGDFLEIEIMSPSDEPHSVNLLRSKLEQFLLKTGIGTDQIEKKYYSELLAEVRCKE